MAFDARGELEAAFEQGRDARVHQPGPRDVFDAPGRREAAGVLGFGDRTLGPRAVVTVGGAGVEAAARESPLQAGDQMSLRPTGKERSRHWSPPGRRREPTAGSRANHRNVVQDPTGVYSTVADHRLPGGNGRDAVRLL